MLGLKAKIASAHSTNNKKDVSTLQARDAWSVKARVNFAAQPDALVAIATSGLVIGLATISAALDTVTYAAAECTVSQGDVMCRSAALPGSRVILRRVKAKSFGSAAKSSSTVYSLQATFHKRDIATDDFDAAEPLQALLYVGMYTYGDRYVVCVWIGRRIPF